ncbi:hypothetical protein QR680_003119 [Steinernema hermaphroditum]|uniref:Uncharacterized protein n=1 Tax=Steinernema hermaphroditum TaxID=289476 RepID=A0AA39H6G3_9BILA|nr:hypothetical protein QR680_003119 [Steinernema hermaphroditum]
MVTLARINELSTSSCKLRKAKLEDDDMLNEIKMDIEEQRVDNLLPYAMGITMLVRIPMSSGQLRRARVTIFVVLQVDGTYSARTYLDYLQ